MVFQGDRTAQMCNRDSKMLLRFQVQIEDSVGVQPVWKGLHIDSNWYDKA